jgi:hypothetical protein
MKKNCNGVLGSFASDPACGECQSCIDQAKAIVGRWFFTPICDVPATAGPAYSLAQTVLLTNLTPIEIEEFKVTLRQRREGGTDGAGSTNGKGGC